MCTYATCHGDPQLRPLCFIPHPVAGQRYADDIPIVNYLHNGVPVGNITESTAGAVRCTCLGCAADHDSQCRVTRRLGRICACVRVCVRVCDFFLFWRALQTGKDVDHTGAAPMRALRGHIKAGDRLLQGERNALRGPD